MGDIIVPRAEERKINTQLPDFEAPVIKTYSLESTIAETFDAILQRFELTGRIKYFDDIYYLSMTFDFDGAKSVSYTHLFSFTVIGFSDCLNAEIRVSPRIFVLLQLEIAKIKLYAVSYTHLDVYKRQHRKKASSPIMLPRIRLSVN